jgi:hypothetical protein
MWQFFSPLSILQPFFPLLFPTHKIMGENENGITLSPPIQQKEFKKLNPKESVRI